MIQPHLVRMRHEDQWQENDSVKFGQNSEKWFVEFGIWMSDKNKQKKWFSNKDKLLLDDCYISVTVCSPSCFSAPPRGKESLKKCALVQDVFSKQLAEEYVVQKLSSIEALDEKELESKLSEFFIVSKSVL